MTEWHAYGLDITLYKKLTQVYLQSSPLARDPSARLEDGQMSYDDGRNKNKRRVFLFIVQDEIYSQ